MATKGHTIATRGSRERAYTSTSGFTIVEVLVALTILMTVIATVFFIAQQVQQSTRLSTDRVTATFLAQDAVEYIKHIRASNIAANNAWLDRIPSQCKNSGNSWCAVDTTSSSFGAEAFDPCGGPSCPALHYDEASRYYQYAEGDESAFTRRIRIESISSSEVMVISQVQWTDPKTGAQQIEITEYLHNWH